MLKVMRRARQGENFPRVHFIIISFEVVPRIPAKYSQKSEAKFFYSNYSSYILQSGMNCCFYHVTSKFQRTFNLCRTAWVTSCKRRIVFLSYFPEVMRRCIAEIVRLN